MSIIYRTTKELNKKDLQDLFLSVGWSSGNYPDQLQQAMENSSTVLTAWNDQQLVGLMNALDDGVMTAYFHYLLVNPDYHGQGIGKALVEQMLNLYKDFARKVLIAYDERIEFYKSCGFEVGEGKTPMFITFLTT